MARRTTVEMVALSASVPRGHEGFWEIIRGLDQSGPWRLHDIDYATNVDRASSKDYVHRLERAGFVQRVGEGPGHKGKGTATLWRLVRAPIEAPRLARDGTLLQEPLSQLLWRTIRIIKSFTIRELAESASLPDRQVSIGRASRYVVPLAEVGVLLPLSTGGTRVGHQYRLVRDLGPKAPMLTRSLMVFDPNTRQVVGAPGLVEVQP